MMGFLLTVAEDESYNKMGRFSLNFRIALVAAVVMVVVVVVVMVMVMLVVVVVAMVMVYRDWTFHPCRVHRSTNRVIFLVRDYAK